MIESIKITSIAYAIDEPTRKYVMKKVGRLDRFLPKHAKRTVSADVRLEQVNHSHGNKYEVEINLVLPGKIVNARDKASNILSAIDIAETRISEQLREYKQKNIGHISRRNVMSLFKRSFQREL